MRTAEEGTGDVGGERGGEMEESVVGQLGLRGVEESAHDDCWGRTMVNIEIYYIVTALCVIRKSYRLLLSAFPRGTFPFWDLQRPGRC